MIKVWESVLGSLERAEFDFSKAVQTLYYSNKNSY